MSEKLTYEDLQALIRKEIKSEIQLLANTPADNRGIIPGGNYTATEEPPELYSSKVEEFPGHFKTFRSFLLECAKNPASQYLTKAVMEEGDPEQGGFLVPEPMGKLLWIDTLGASVIYGKVRHEKMTSWTQKFPRIVDTDHSSNLFGGLSFRFAAEKATKTTTKPKIAQIELKARTLYAMTDITNQLLEDSKESTEMMLRKMYTDGVAWEMDRLIFRGTGAGQPLGILGSGSLITENKEVGQAAGTLIYENVLKMYERLIPSLEGKAVWYFSTSCKSAVMSFNLAIGTGGSATFLGSGEAARPIPKTLFGIPIQWTEHCSPIGTVGDVILVVPGAYLVGIRSPLAIKANPWSDTSWTKNQTSIRGELRVDGQPQIDEKLTLRDGSNSVSPFIVMETRS